MSKKEKGLKAKIVWIKKRQYNYDLGDGSMLDLHEEVDWEVRTNEPDYDIDLWDKFVLIPLED
jgi:hypothetical protein